MNMSTLSDKPPYDAAWELDRPTEPNSEPLPETLPNVVEQDDTSTSMEEDERAILEEPLPLGATFSFDSILQANGQDPSDEVTEITSNRWIPLFEGNTVLFDEIHDDDTVDGFFTSPLSPRPDPHTMIQSMSRSEATRNQILCHLKAKKLHEKVSSKTNIASFQNTQESREHLLHFFGASSVKQH